MVEGWFAWAEVSTLCCAHLRWHFCAGSCVGGSSQLDLQFIPVLRDEQVQRLDRADGTDDLSPGPLARATDAMISLVR